MRCIGRLLAAAAMAAWASGALAQAVPVTLEKTARGWQLFRDGQPYLVKGAGGDQQLRELVAAGGNSIRTWGADDIGPLLDEAQSLGLTVTVGLWLGHERHGFDYHDAQQVKEQYERVRREVLRYKDHPAVLIWGVGNEMEGFEAGDDPAIWRAVNEIAEMIKRMDPQHPTMTVTADIGGGRIQSINEYCPAIDIHGINAYGGVSSLPERYRAGGGIKPYLVTEFGPPGHWESPTTPWGAPLELTSTEKALHYRRGYELAVLGAPGLSLGAYAFLWGYKMEATATWFGMFLPDGSRLAAVDAMTEVWGGEAPANRAPAVSPLAASGDTRLDPGDELLVTTAVNDPEGDTLQARWVLRPEPDDYDTGGDFRPNLPAIDGAIIEQGVDRVRLRAPDEPGPYRLFLYVYDQAGNAATANLPLLVKGEVRTRFPVSVYEDSLEGMRWVPSGWMGNIDALSMDGAHAGNPQAGMASIRFRYTGEYGWVAVAWQHPENNWGQQAGGMDLTGAKALEFWARGEYGGERINAAVGLLGDDVPFPDSSITKLDGIVLTDRWQRYTVKLGGADLSSITTAFVLTILGRESPVTVYVDSVRFVR